MSDRLWRVSVDLRGNTVFPEASAVELVMAWDDADDLYSLRDLIADHYGVPVASVGDPRPKDAR